MKRLAIMTGMAVVYFCIAIYARLAIFAMTQARIENSMLVRPPTPKEILFGKFFKLLGFPFVNLGQVWHYSEYNLPFLFLSNFLWAAATYALIGFIMRKFRMAKR